MTQLKLKPIMMADAPRENKNIEHQFYFYEKTMIKDHLTYLTSKSHAGQSPAFLCRLCCKFPKKIYGSKNPNFSRITAASKRFHYINGFFHFLRQLDGQSTWIQKNVTRRHVRIQKNIGSPIWYIRYFRDVAETLKRLYFYIIRDVTTLVCCKGGNQTKTIRLPHRWARS